MMKTAEEMVKEKGQEIFSVSPETTIFEALQVMLKHRIGAILVKKDDQFVGIWTERDLMANTVLPGFDPKTALIKDYMVKGLQDAPCNEPVYKLFDKFLGIRLRHLLIKKDDKYLGLLSTGDVMKTFLVEKSLELEELNSIVSWEYYENWRWKK
jgi:signal-transduction protein with cAMP-binding, CBS, and nucleotidyltransferase domain